MSLDPNKNFTVDIGERLVPLTFRRNPRARQLILRIDAKTCGAVITLPKRASLKEGMALAHGKIAWITKRLNALPARVPFADGAIVPLLGNNHRIVHMADDKSPVYINNDEIIVSGRGEHLPRRLTDWLKKEAKRHIIPSSEAKAALLGRRLRRISIRDTRSRWGSCSASGNMSFCWRLVMAPKNVLDYVVAHEVAHLEHMNHGAEFWHTVARLTDNIALSRKWLKNNGKELHRYG